ncbi:MAG TPA: RES domain-containing protein [Longimicrobiales bacterium]|nr:RES domain-containing protein [Longimicrobiales bacterium]
MTAWRIVKKRHAESAFDGEGARRYGGRWNSPGTAVVYACESRALCLLEVLAGLRTVNPLDAYVLIPITFDESSILSLEVNDLPAEWRRYPPHASTQQAGDDWARDKRSVMLRVPSVIVPQEFNYLLDPAHPDFRHIDIGRPQELSIDVRLVR